MATATRSHIGRKTWPHLEAFLEQEARRLGLPLPWLQARLTADVVDGITDDGILWFSIYCLDTVGMAGANLLLLQVLGVLLTTAGLPFAGAGDWYMTPGTPGLQNWTSSVKAFIAAP